MIRFFILFLLASNISFAQRNIDKVLSAGIENLKSDTADNSMNKSFNKRISLEEINNSNSKIDIRLYTLRSLSNTKTLKRIYLNDTTWKADEFEELNNPVTIRKYKLSAIPNYDSLILKLLSYNLLTLPPQSNLKSKMKKFTGNIEEGDSVYRVMAVTDGDEYYIEIKIRNKFRVYEFDNPNKYSNYYDNVNEFKNFANIITTFDKYLKPDSLHH